MNDRTSARSSLPSPVFIYAWSEKSEMFGPVDRLSARGENPPISPCGLLSSRSTSCESLALSTEKEITYALQHRTYQRTSLPDRDLPWLDRVPALQNLPASAGGQCSRGGGDSASCSKQSPSPGALRRRSDQSAALLAGPEARLATLGC